MAGGKKDVEPAQGIPEENGNNSGAGRAEGKSDSPAKKTKRQTSKAEPKPEEKGIDVMNDSPAKKMGRPRKVIIKNEFEKLCTLQCTQEEICGWFGVSPDTITRWCKRNYDGKTFAEAFKQFSADGKISLRRHQFRLAEKSAAMAIFLGKQMLGQRDDYSKYAAEEEERHTEAKQAPLVINYNYGSPEDYEWIKELKREGPGKG